MKYIEWDELKNELLKNERGVGFEDVLSAIEDNRVLDIKEHPNKKMYSHQQILIVQLNNYAYLVPFVEDEVKIFLKTIIPSRRETKKHLRKEQKQ